MNFLQTIFIFFCVFSSVLCRGLQEEFSWTRIDYEWQNDGNGPRYSGNSGRPSRPSRPANVPYIYQNNIPMGANAWNEKLFITVPRRRVGVPSTLNYIWVNSSNHQNVPLKPYPDWTTNTLPESGSSDIRFVSVYRVAVDDCDRLWFVDTGRIETPGNPQQIQPHALIIMDLKTAKIIHRHIFDTSLIRPNTGLASVTVDVTPNKCGDAYAYIPDLGGFGLIVFSLKQDKSWRVNHNYFYMEPLAGDFSIGGHDFQWNDGIFSIAVTDVKPDGYRDAYFHSMAGFNLYKVSTRVLKNENLATRSFHGQDFEYVGNRGKLSQTSSSDLLKSKGILFLGLVNQNALACWNINTPLSDISIIQSNNKTMIYPSDVKVCGETVVVLTNTMPVFLYGTLDYDEVNFRVWIEAVDTAIRGTKCVTRKGRKN